jgi:AcrR family transcriptional regulator
VVDGPSTGHPFADALLRGGPADGGTRANSRAALLDAAIDEFAAKGYEAATVASIAQRAGVTTGALYAHFSGKLDLLLAAIGLTPVDQIQRSAEEVGSLPRGAAAASLRRSLGASPDDRMVLLLDVIVVARRDPRIAKALRSGLEAYVAATARVVEAATASGDVSPVTAASEVSRLLALISLGRTVFAALEARPPSSAAFERLGDVLLQPVPPAEAARTREESANDPLIARVRALAAAASQATAALNDAIGDAVASGFSLRQVGAAAELSNERVRKILRDRTGA